MLGRTLPACVSSHLWPSCLSPKLCSCDSKRHPMPADCKASKMALLLWTKSLSKTKGEMHHSKVWPWPPPGIFIWDLAYCMTQHCIALAQPPLICSFISPSPNHQTRKASFPRTFSHGSPMGHPKNICSITEKRGLICCDLYYLCTLALHTYNYWTTS